MKERIQNGWNFIKAHPKRFILLGLVVLGIFFIASNKANNGIQDVKVERGDLVSEVAVTGKTKAVENVDLAFETTGKVSSAPFGVGSRVSSGTLLASLDGSALSADLARAEANLREAQLKLTTSEQSATSGYSDARLNAIIQIRDAYAKADNALHNNIDRFFRNPRQDNTYVEFTFTDDGYQYSFPLDTSLKININKGRVEAEHGLRDLQSSLSNLDAQTASELQTSLLKTQNFLSQTQGFLNLMAQAANSLEVTDFEYEATINGYKTTIQEARTAINSAQTNVISAKEKLTNAPVVIGEGNGSLSDISIQEAQVAQFAAEVQSKRAALEKTVIYSPISGVITKQDAKVGEIVTSGTNIISVISDNNLEIEANVSEVNIGKISVNNPVSITFDAYPNKEYQGTLFYIDPGETIVDGVVNFKVKISIDGEIDQNLKSGLTANISIKTGNREGVLKVPQYAIVERDGQSFVRKVFNGGVSEVPVTLGFTSTDGFVEVMEGLSEGDTVRVGNE